MAQEGPRYEKSNNNIIKINMKKEIEVGEGEGGTFVLEAVLLMGGRLAVFGFLASEAHG